MKSGWLVLSVAVIVTVALLGGCSGHGGQAPPNGGTGQAAFVGRAVCGTCHSGINTAYGSYNGVAFVPGTVDPSHVFANFTGSAHGQDMRSKGPNNRNVQDNPACVPCHVTGFEEATGYKSDAETPHLEGIGCEECHGKGSLHAGAPSSSNINKLPPASTTCWDCHVPSYKLLRGPVPDVNDQTFINTAPKSVGPHNRQAPLLVGVLAYNQPQLPSPHSAIENTCVTCHLSEGSTSRHGSSALAVDFDACVVCHGSEANAEQMVEDFEAEMNALGIELAGEDPSNPGQPDPNCGGGLLAAFAAANGIDVDNNSNPDDPAVKAYKAARYDFAYAFSSGMVHNPPLVEQMLADAKALVD